MRNLIVGGDIIQAGVLRPEGEAPSSLQLCFKGWSKRGVLRLVVTALSGGVEYPEDSQSFRVKAWRRRSG